MKKYSIIIFAIFLCILNVKAQELALFSAKLIDAETTIPIKDANIYTKKSGYGVSSDQNGNFRILVYPNDTVIVSCLGYEKTAIPILDFNGFESKNYILRIKPIVYTLQTVEIKDIVSVVIKPSEVYESVKVEGLEPQKDKFKVDLGNDLSVDLKKPETNFGVENFGVGLTINGFLSSLLKKESKELRKLKVVEQTDKRTEFFHKFLASDELKDILINNYGMSEEEYIVFIEEFAQDAGRIKYATNKYDILKKIDSIINNKY
ncbi:MAG: carboxypeptidase-like regulatory domain-containing protein [Bacteroidales bacterium]|jgi:hypothetical protein